MDLPDDPELLDLLARAAALRSDSERALAESLSAVRTTRHLVGSAAALLARRPVAPADLAAPRFHDAARPEPRTSGPAAPATVTEWTPTNCSDAARRS